MKIYQVNYKRAYLCLLLLADEQESMIEKYLDRGTMYVLDDYGVKAEIVVCDEGNGLLEIKNLAVEPQYDLLYERITINNERLKRLYL